MYIYKKPPIDIAVGDLVKKIYKNSYIEDEEVYGVGVVTKVRIEPDWGEVQIFYNHTTPHISTLKGKYVWVVLSGEIEILVKANGKEVQRKETNKSR